MPDRQAIQAQLKAFQIPDPAHHLRHQQEQCARLPEPLRGAVAVLVLPFREVKFDERERAWQTLLSSPGDQQRTGLQIIFPKLADWVAAGLNLLARLPYPSGVDRRAFRVSPDHPVLQDLRMRWLTQLQMATREYAQDVTWYATWIGHIFAYGASEALGPLFATAIDSDTDEGKAVLEALAATADGTHPTAMMSRAVVRGLVASSRVAAWEVVERLLLAAQRQEGLRQSILEAIDEAHPEAFRRMLRLIVAHDLTRFSATVRAVDVWFGFGWDVTDARAVRDAIGQALEYLENPTARAQALASEEGAQVYLALWAIAFRDALAAVAAATPLLNAPAFERRIAAAYLLGQIHLPGSCDSLPGLLADPDLRVAACALAGIQRDRYGVEAPGLFEQLEALIARLPAGSKELGHAFWPWLTYKLDRAEVASILPGFLGGRSPERLIPHLKAMNVHGRFRVADLLANRRTWDEPTLAALLDLLGDPGNQVRQRALEAFTKRTVDAGVVARTESYLSRQAPDLRRGVIQLLLSQDDAQALHSAERLLTAKSELQRAGGFDLLVELRRQSRAVDRVATLAKAHTPRSTVEQVAFDALQHLDAQEPTLEDGLGLFDPEQRTPPLLPAEKKHRRPWVTPAAEACMQSLDDLIHTHRHQVVTVKYGSQVTETLLGDLQWGLPLPQPFGPLAPEWDQLPLYEIWRDWELNRPVSLRDRDGLELIRALALVHGLPGRSREPEARWIQVLRQRMFGRLDGHGLRYERQLTSVLQWFVRLQAHSAAPFLLDAVEDTLAGIPAAEVRPTREQELHRGSWRYNRLLLSWLERASADFRTQPERWTPEDQARLWGLLRWRDEPLSPGGIGTWLQQLVRGRRDSTEQLERLRPQLFEINSLIDSSVVNDADLLDLLIGPRTVGRYLFGRYFPELNQATKRRNRGPAAHPRLTDLADRCRERILEVELVRGEMPTAATLPALSLAVSGGMDTLFRVLRAFPDAGLVRGWAYDGESRDAVFSHLVRASLPGDGDTPDAFHGPAQDLPPTRLLEVAMYAPQWAAHVERALGWPGLAEAIWWVHAHTKDRLWHVNTELREVWAAQVSEYTPLTSADLLDGAVDVAWFQRVYVQLGQKRWAQVFKAARYASSGQGHTRARLFASAMLGEIAPADLRERIQKKRHQDSVRALGLVPIQGDPDVLGRYTAIHEFMRGARKFGSQRQASERLSARIALDNLARTAGYPDPIRLEWSMELAAVVDLAQGPVAAESNGVRVTLSVSALGDAELAIEKGGKAMKAVPAKQRKDPAIKALVERKQALNKQAARMRQSLETAMCRGDTFTAAEVQQLHGNPLLAPMLESLVFVAPFGLGYPVDSGRRLEDHTGASRRLDAETPLRLAHPVDLWQAGDWDHWQRECFVRERIQPFKQIFRELYVLTEAEKADGVHARRYAGHQVNPKQAVALLTARGWVAGQDEGAARTFHDQDLTARLTGLGVTFTPADVEGTTLEGVVFMHRGQWDALPLEQIPPRTFSEVMRDLDLVVSVAHMGGVDPEASASTIEMRARLVRETAVLLKLSNVRVERNHVLIEGVYASYTIHLGSAIVHQQPGGALCIVPVHSQHRGRLFLPFVDDDPRTAEVMAKVVLLARDHDIKDPTILEQMIPR